METFFIVSAAFAVISFPTDVDPVKLTFFTAGCVYSSVTALRSFVVTTWITFNGIPASTANPANARVQSGVSLGGLITTVHPAAMAGPTLRVIMAIGKFQGAMIPHTPIG